MYLRVSEGILNLSKFICEYLRAFKMHLGEPALFLMALEASEGVLNKSEYICEHQKEFCMHLSVSGSI